MATVVFDDAYATVIDILSPLQRLDFYDLERTRESPAGDSFTETAGVGRKY
jgi:hypothetical protein